MITEPINDRQCLELATAKAKEWSRTLAARAGRYRSTRELAEELRRLPQLDDDGRSGAPAIACEYPVRLRQTPGNPNCVERAVWYLALAEAIDPTTSRALLTVPVRAGRHTAVAERRGGEWVPVDLSPVRTSTLRNGPQEAEVLSAVQRPVHAVGGGLLRFFGGQELGGGVADQLGEWEEQGIAEVHGGSRPEAAAAKTAAKPARATPTARPIASTNSSRPRLRRKGKRK